MKGAVEYEMCFLESTRKWNKRLERLVKSYKRKYPFWREEYRIQHIREILAWKKQRMVGIWHREQGTDGFYKNNFLAEFYALGSQAHNKYALHPYGNFIHHDLPRLIKKHSILAETAKNWYRYKEEAFTWKTNDFVDKLALYNMLNGELDLRRENTSTDVPGHEVKQRASQMPSARKDIEEKAGILVLTFMLWVLFLAVTVVAVIVKVVTVIPAMALTVKLTNYITRMVTSSEFLMNELPFSAQRGIS